MKYEIIKDQFSIFLINFQLTFIIMYDYQPKNFLPSICSECIDGLWRYVSSFP